MKKRKFERYDSENLISYSILDEKDNEIEQSLGRALNISKNGVLLETYHPLESRTGLLLVVQVQDQIVQMKARCIYRRETDPGTFVIGIHFEKMKKDEFTIWDHYIKGFEARRTQKKVSHPPQKKVALNLTTFITREHLIIPQYIQGFKEMFTHFPANGKFDPQNAPPPEQVETLMTLFQQELLTHFHSEDSVIFKLPFKSLPQKYRDMITNFKSEHKAFLIEIDFILNLLDEKQTLHLPIDYVLLDRIITFFKALTTHVSLETKRLLPEIEKNTVLTQQILAELNKTASKA